MRIMAYLGNLSNVSSTFLLLDTYPTIVKGEIGTGTAIVKGPLEIDTQIHNRKRANLVSAKVRE